MRADILTWVDFLSGGLADQALCDRFLTEVTELLAKTTELFVMSQLQEHDAETATFTLPDDGIRLLAAFYDAVQLSPTTQKALESLSRDWRDRVGSPSSVIEETEGDRKFRLYPKPDGPSSAFVFDQVQPLGEDYPSGAVHLLYTYTADPVPIFCELPIALLVLEREFERESNHSNAELAKAYGEVGRLLLAGLST